jgi:hypothetical protein
MKEHGEQHEATDTANENSSQPHDDQVTILRADRARGSLIFIRPHIISSLSFPH